MCSAGAAEAVSVVDGGATVRVSWPVTAAVPVTLIGSGFGEQVTPAGNPAAGQVTFTLPRNPPVGVTVVVDIPLPPAVAVVAAPLTVNEPLLVIVKATPLLATPPTVTTTLPVVAPVGTGTTMLVALQLVGVPAVPLKVTVLVPRVAPKFVPVIVTDVPTAPEVGFRLVIVGAAAAVMVKVGGFGLVSGPPPGCGLNVSTLTVWAVARLAAGTCTVRVPEFVTATALAGSEMVLNCTSVAPARKLLPFTVKVSPLDPAAAVVGEIEVIPGMGLRTVKGTALVVLPVSATVIWARAPLCS